MPVERVSRGFKDISSSFKVNPLNEDLIAIKNETAIARSVRNLILTRRGERFFNPILGSYVTDSLFDFVDYGSASTIKEEIITTLENFEPRIDNIQVECIPRPDRNNFEVTVFFEIVGEDVPTQEFTFMLEATR